MTTTVFVPIDATARSLGADAVAAAIVREAAARGEAVQVVRNGTRGMCWLEPLVEVATNRCPFRSKVLDSVLKSSTQVVPAGGVPRYMNSEITIPVRRLDGPKLSTGLEYNPGADPIRAASTQIIARERGKPANLGERE